jgi:hypothetical protein
MKRTLMPAASWLTGNKPHPEVEDVANSENLAGNENQEQGEEDQVETEELVEMRGPAYNTSKN